MIRKITNKDGTVRYQARVTVLGQRLYNSCATKQEASAWINEVRFKRDNKVTFYQKVSIDEMFENYLENAKNKGNAISSIKKAEFAFRNHLKPYYGDCDMVNISIQEHRALITYLREKALYSGYEPKNGKHPIDNTMLSNATVNRVRSLISSMFNIAITQRTFGDLFQTNPFQAIRPMKEMNQRLEYWDLESIGQFLDSEKESHYYPLWVLMLNTGLRVGESVAVHGEQVDRFADIITIDRIYCMATNNIRPQTKSCRLRELGLNEAIKKVLYPFTTHNGPLFFKEDGDRLRTDFLIKTVFPEACKRAEVRNIGLHGLRHTYASHYMMNGGNLYDLQKTLGHSNIKTTERYAHFSRLHIKQKSNIVGFEGNVIKVHFKPQEAVLEGYGVEGGAVRLIASQHRPVST